ncbi:uncharacterized protein RCC_03769 [Ramularia collo-cygni]|uniref:Uncharacterized protein n=1 Tax=Ramularia collo-cygni TaxID=112498 RepID=A0A2D3UQE3_9PEZI|nr:uncharacterized protein RCC_03769 [Ramularia collo-cygni]CZT17931.1 uncharacterized protein RCC_03769 [Ramularia collo-cygni]
MPDLEDIYPEQYTYQEYTCPFTISDLSAAPMDECHKEEVVRHYDRLCRIIDEPDQYIRDAYTDKKSAREQLARMTLVIRDFMILHRIAIEQGGEPNDTIETMVVDVVGASLFLPNSRTLAYASRQPRVGEAELEFLMHDLGSVGSFPAAEISPWGSKELPDDVTCSNKIGEDFHPRKNWKRSRSYDDLLYHRSDFVIEDKEKWDAELRGYKFTERKALGLSWTVEPEDS